MPSSPNKTNRSDFLKYISMFFIQGFVWNAIRELNLNWGNKEIAPVTLLSEGAGSAVTFSSIYFLISFLQHKNRRDEKKLTEKSGLLQSDISSLDAQLPRSGTGSAVSKPEEDPFIVIYEDESTLLEDMLDSWRPTNEVEGVYSYKHPTEKFMIKAITSGPNAVQYFFFEDENSQGKNLGDYKECHEFIRDNYPMFFSEIPVNSRKNSIKPQSNQNKLLLIHSFSYFMGSFAASSIWALMMIKIEGGILSFYSPDNITTFQSTGVDIATSLITGSTCASAFALSQMIVQSIFISGCKLSSNLNTSSKENLNLGINILFASSLFALTRYVEIFMPNSNFAVNSVKAGAAAAIGACLGQFAIYTANKCRPPKVKVRHADRLGAEPIKSFHL